MSRQVLWRWVLGNRWRLSAFLPFALFLALAGLTSYFAWKFARQAKPDGTSVLAFVIASGVLLAMSLWGRELVRRVRKVGAAGVELDVWQEIVRIPELQEIPSLPALQKEVLELDPQQTWFYELSSSLLFHLFHLGVKADDLEGEQLRRYRDIVVWVGKAALTKLDYYKAVDTLKSVECVADLSSDELYCVAEAYFGMARYESNSGIRAERYPDLLRRSQGLLQRALSKQPDHAAAHFTLGYIYDELGEFKKAVDQNQLAIDNGFDSPYGAYWNMAVSYVKLAMSESAFEALSHIPRSEWWNELSDDPELDPLKELPAFIRLRDERTVPEPKG